MKTRFALLLILFCTLNLIGQDSSEAESTIFEKKHEVRLGTIKLLAGGIIEGSYEYVINSNQGFGTHALVSFGSGTDWFQKYALTPYYRMYFQSKKDYGAKGFFVEGFTSLFTTNFELLEVNQDDYVFDTAIGLGLGQKWINTSGFVFEIKVGVGRNLLGNANFDALFMGDFYIGYRF